MDATLAAAWIRDLALAESALSRVAGSPAAGGDAARALAVFRGEAPPEEMADVTMKALGRVTGAAPSWAVAPLTRAHARALRRGTWPGTAADWAAGAASVNRTRSREAWRKELERALAAVTVEERVGAPAFQLCRHAAAAVKGLEPALAARVLEPPSGGGRVSRVVIERRLARNTRGGGMILLLLAACLDRDKPAGPFDRYDGWYLIEDPGPYTEVDAEELTLCAVQEDGLPHCFSGMYEADPEVVVHGLRVGSAAAVALDADGQVICWDGYGSPCPTGTGFVAVDMHLQGGCATTQDGDVECWDDDGLGQGEPMPDLTFRQAGPASGDYCAIADEGFACWGTSLEPVVNPGSFVELRIDGVQCALDENGGVWCWSRYDDYPKEATLVAEGADTITVGGSTVCWTSGGTVGCQELFWNVHDIYWKGVAHAPPGTFVQLAMPWDALCGLTDEGALLCWSDDAEELPWFRTDPTPYE